MKRITTLLLALVMALSLAVPAAAAPITFTDVKTSDWFFSDVQKAVNTGLIQGYPDNTYGPAKNMTYAEAIKLAAVMYKMSMTGSNEFETGNPWYQPYVDYAKNSGVISRDYEWDKPATRAGYMEIFARAIPDMPANSGMKGLAPINPVADGSIPDVPMTHPQAAAIYKLYRAGILQGSDAQHTCRPESNIQRSEVAAILTRMMNAGERLSFSMGEEDALMIATQPKDVTAAEGTDVTFAVAATGGKAPYTYQWKEITLQGNSYGLSDGTENYAGTKTAVLTVRSPAVRISESGTQYCCYVYDASGAEVISDKATLTVTAAVSPLEIAAQPADVTAAEGADAVFTVAAAGGKTPYTYEWRRIRKADSADMDLSDWTYLSGSKTAALTVKNLVAGETGDRYYCIITDADNKTVTSGRAELTVAPAGSPLTITAQPKDAAADRGGDAAFTVEVTGGRAPYTYQWCYCNAGETTRHVIEDIAEYYAYFSVANDGGKSTLTASSIGTNFEQNGDRYFCEISDADGKTVTSGTAALTVSKAELTVTCQSGTFTVDKGVNIGLQVEVSGGKAPYTYQWYYCNPGDTTYWRVEDAAEWYELFDIINRESKSILGIREAGTRKDQNGSKYYCVVTDADNNSAASKVITLRVRP